MAGPHTCSGRGHWPDSMARVGLVMLPQKMENEHFRITRDLLDVSVSQRGAGTISLEEIEIIFLNRQFHHH